MELLRNQPNLQGIVDKIRRMRMAETHCFEEGWQEVERDLRRILGPLREGVASFRMLYTDIESELRSSVPRCQGCSHAPDLWKDMLARLEEAGKEGVPIYGQTAGRP